MTRIEVWAPQARQVLLAIGDERRPMTAGGPGQADGWWALDAADAVDGSRYAFVVISDDRPAGDARELPDPRSRRQPDGVHRRSAVVDDTQFAWTDAGWRGVSLPGAVLYELHVGTFTAEGTFDAAVERLDHLVDLGVDAVELLPCNAFDGERGWGYDGVDLFAVHEPYGGPEGLKRFVDACHGRGIGVVMDVVYNHLGPSGNYLAEFGPYFTDAHSTPWGAAVNLDAEGSDEVRRFLLDNALTWLRDYHCDGLRLDAVHALRDDRAVHLLEELSHEVERLGVSSGRPLFLIAESDLNDPRLVRPVEAGGYGLDAQWCDDVHHALWASLSGERQGYYVDFGPLAVLGKALTSAFVHDGTWSTFRGRSHGRPATGVPATRFVTFLQDHDQIGNRAQGDRAAATLSDGLLKVGAGLLLLSPFTPMLFMGEEWGARTPWQFFSDHSGELGEAVRTGRRAEFGAHGWATEDVPDPQDPETARRSMLDWDEPGTERGAALLDWHRRLVAIRRGEPDLSEPSLAKARAAWDEEQRWLVLYRGSLAVVANLGPDRVAVPLDGTPVDVVLSSEPGFSHADGRIDLPGESLALVRLL